MRRTITKPAKKGSRAPRLRAEMNRADSSSSSSGASKATLMPETDVTTRSPSPRPPKPRRSSSSSPRKALTSQGLSVRPKSPVLRSPPRPKSPIQAASSRPKSPLPRSPTDLASPIKRTRSRTQSPITSAESSRSTSKTRSPKKKTATAKSPAGETSPVKETATVKSPVKRKVSKSPKRPDSFSPPTCSGTRPKSSTSEASKATALERSVEKVDQQASTSKATGGKSYVFLPTSKGLDGKFVGRQISQLYGFMRTTETQTSPDAEAEPSATPSESDERRLDVVIMDDPPRPTGEDQSEQLIAGVESLSYVSSSSKNTAARTSSSSSTSSSTTTIPRGRLPYLGELNTRRHSADAAIGTLQLKPAFLLRRFRDSSSSLAIEIHELKPLPPTPVPPKRSESLLPTPPAKPARKKSVVVEADIHDMPPLLKSSTAESGPPRPSFSAYRDTRVMSFDSEGSDRLNYLIYPKDETEDDADEFRSNSNASSTDVWQACYQGFIVSFRETSATAQQFFQHLSGTLLADIRQPGQSAARRFLLIAGQHIWILIRQASNDYWFLCGRSDSSAQVAPPAMSLSSSVDPEPSTSQSELVPNLTKIAMKAAAKAAKKAEKKMKREKAEKETSVRLLLEPIRSATKPLEPRRDFVPNDCPFITLTFHDSDNKPEEAAEDEAPGTASTEAQPAEDEAPGTATTEAQRAEGEVPGTATTEAQRAEDEVPGTATTEAQPAKSQSAIPTHEEVEGKAVRRRESRRKKKKQADPVPIA